MILYDKTVLAISTTFDGHVHLYSLSGLWLSFQSCVINHLDRISWTRQIGHLLYQLFLSHISIIFRLCYLNHAFDKWSLLAFSLAMRPYNFQANYFRPCLWLVVSTGMACIMLKIQTSIITCHLTFILAYHSHFVWSSLIHFTFNSIIIFEVLLFL